jgi:hypothetical protein
VGGSSQGGSVAGGAAGEVTTPGASGEAGTGDLPNGGEPLPNCTTSGWCWDNPTPGGSNLNGVWAGAPDNVWAVGMDGLILRYDGKRWQRFAGPTTKTLFAVWGTAADSVWIGGAGGLFFWNGKEFTTYPSSSSIIDVHGSAADNVRGTLGTQAIDYFDGKKLTIPVLTEGGPTSSVVSVWTFAPRVAYGAGSGGAIIRADGPFDQPFDYATSIVYTAGGYLRDLWGTTADEALWAVGDAGLVVSGQVADKTSFHVVDSGTITALYGVWGSSQSDIWAVGDTGTIIHYDGTGFEDRSVAAPRIDFRDIDGTGKSDIWAVGNDGAIFHFDGSKWSAPNTLTDQELFGVWGTSDDDVWAVGDQGVLLHKDASGWQSLESPTTAAMRSVYTAAPNDVYLTSDDSNIYHFDGKDFTVSFAPRYYASYLWGSAGDDIWASGGGDTYLYDGESWEPFDLPFNGIYDIWRSSPTELWISRGRDGFYHLKDGVATSGNDFAMGFLWGTAPDDLWSVHDDSGIRHWDGQAWTVVPASSLSSPHAMWASAPDNMWIVGQLGTTDFFDGVALHHVSDTNDDELDATLNAVWVSPTGKAYAVGDAGTIVVHQPGL